MYQAIVFLPLLGFIIAGLISLAGARGRFPGQDPSPGAENTTHDHGPHAGGGAPSPHGEHAVIHHPATEAGHGAHAAAEPAAAGSRFAEAVTTALLFISMLLSWWSLVRVGFNHQEERVPVVDFSPF